MSARNCKRLLHECLKELRLPTMRTGFAEVAEQGTRRVVELRAILARARRTGARRAWSQAH